MARVKPEEIVEHLDSEFRRALAAAVHQILPSAQFNEHQLFRAFKREVGRKCSTWEHVSDSYVEL